jgi:hypothetical protein
VDVLGRVFITVENLSAFGACPITNIQREFGYGKPAAVTAFGRWEEPVGKPQFFAIPKAFVCEHLTEHPKAGARDVLCEGSVFYHSSHVEILNGNYVKLADESSSEFVERVFPGVCDFRVAACHPYCGSFPAVAPFGFSRQLPLQRCELRGTLHRVARIGYSFSIAKSRQSGNSKVNPNFLSGLREVWNGFIKSQRHEVASIRILD